MIEKENLTDTIKLSRLLPNYSKYTMNQVFNLHDPLDTIPLSNLEVDNIFVRITNNFTLELLQSYQIFDPVIRQLKS